MLAPHHQDLLTASAVDGEVARERGYTTAETKGELAAIGFSPAQRLAPGLLIPIWGVDGAIVLHQLRPDAPRKTDKGKPLKYETPKGARMAIDVHPRARAALVDPSVPLFIAEGVRKADAAVTKGLCCIGLLGVWNFRGTGASGGKAVLPDWERIAFNNDRKVYVCFDSDVMEKREVHGALARLKGFLESRGAKVRLVYLPAGDGGVKVGLDDFFVQGKSVDDLLALSEAELRGKPLEEAVTAAAGAYREKHGRLFFVKTVATETGAEEIEEPLTNFTGRILADVVEDDGMEEHRFVELELTVRGTAPREIVVPADAFEAFTWPTKQLGSGAIVEPGRGKRDLARAAIQELSSLDGPPPERRVYVHTGWRKHEDEWVYLHGGGAIGEDGLLGGVRAKLDDRLGRYDIPAPPEDLRAAVRSSLKLLELAPLRITAPIYAGIWRAPLGPSDFSLFVHGPTGNGKSELCALAQQHYGRAMDARNLPESWESTANALEGFLFLAKDALVVIDDFLLKGSIQDRLRMCRDADRVLRAQGNGAGRGRMKDSSALRATKRSRALVLTTGEDLPPGSSLTARMLVMPLRKGELAFARLNEAQKEASRGVYAQAMAGYLRWLAPRVDELRAELAQGRAEHRGAFAVDGLHARTADVGASLSVGLRMFVRYAVEVKALDEDEADRLLVDLLDALHEAVAGQAEAQRDNDPVRRFFELLEIARHSGRMHLVGPDGRVPSNEPLEWGWRRLSEGRESRRGEGPDGESEPWVPDFEREREVWQAQGPRAGWVDKDEQWLMPEIAYRVARDLAGEEWSAPSSRQLALMLQERGLLLSSEDGHASVKAPRRFEGANRVRVWHLRVASGARTWAVPASLDSSGASEA